MTALANVGRPADRRNSGEKLILDAVELALESLCEPTPRQTQLLENRSEVVNKGRLIVITTVVDDFYRKSILTTAQEKIMKINQENAGHDGDMMTLNHVELVLVHTTPTGIEYRIRCEQDKLETVSPLLSTIFYSVVAGPGLSMKMLYLCLKHYDLASTTGVYKVPYNLIIFSHSYLLKS